LPSPEIGLQNSINGICSRNASIGFSRNMKLQVEQRLYLYIFLGLF